MMPVADYSHYNLPLFQTVATTELNVVCYHVRSICRRTLKSDKKMDYLEEEEEKRRTLH